MKTREPIFLKKKKKLILKFFFINLEKLIEYKPY